MTSDDVHKQAFWTNIWNGTHASTMEGWEKKREEAGVLTERDLFYIREYVNRRGKIDKTLIMKMAREILKQND